MDAAQFPVWTTLDLGFVLGLRHALDADHPAAGLFSLGFGLYLLWDVGRRLAASLELVYTPTCLGL